jgi:hypothetical protein
MVVGASINYIGLDTESCYGDKMIFSVGKPNSALHYGGSQHVNQPIKVKMNYNVEVSGSATEHKGFPGSGVEVCCSIQRPRPVSSRSLQPLLSVAFNWA